MEAFTELIAQLKRLNANLEQLRGVAPREQIIAVPEQQSGKLKQLLGEIKQINKPSLWDKMNQDQYHRGVRNGKV